MSQVTPQQAASFTKRHPDLTPAEEQAAHHVLVQKMIEDRKRSDEQSRIAHQVGVRTKENFRAFQ